MLDRAKDTAATLCEPHSGLTIGFADNGSAIAQADVVVLSVPFPHAAATVIEHRSRFAEGALLIDVTVPVTFESGRVRVIDVVEGSASEHVRACLPASVSVAGAFKTVPAALLREVQQPLDCDDLVCGDSAATRQRAMAIIQRIHGLRPIDAGPLEAARIIEGMTLLAIKLNRRYKTRDARFRVVGI